MMAAANYSTAAPAGPTWGSISDRALTRAIAADSGKVDPFPAAYTGAAIALRRGWTPQAKSYLAKVLKAQRPNGGWGTPFGDTRSTHAVTTSQHVGPFLLMGYKAGLVPRKTVEKSLDFLYTLDRDKTPSGYCIAPNDRNGKGVCIHNISAGIGLYIRQAWDAGIRYRKGPALDWPMQIARREAAAYKHIPRSWTYREGYPALNDQDHNALSIEAMLTLAPAIGRHALDYSIAGAHDTSSPLAHAHLARFHRDGGKWRSEVDAYVDTIPQAPGRPGQNIKHVRYAQIAYWAALNAKAEQ